MPDRAKCTKAVIATAGFGTRRLPITKAIEKSMLPIGDRPIIDYIVEDCIKAGITDIIFVVSELSQQIRTYYGSNEILESYLDAVGKQEALTEIQGIASKANFHFVLQPPGELYGTSIPVWLAKDLLADDEPFLFLYGDNIFYNQDGSSAIASFMEDAIAADAKGAMMAVVVPHELVSSYGIVATEERNGLEMYQRIVEKPKIEDAPGNLSNAGCFMISPDIFPYVEQSITHAPQAEKYFIDALNWYVQDGNDIAVIRTNGEFIDCGTIPGWLHANNLIAGS